VCEQPQPSGGHDLVPQNPPARNFSALNTSRLDTLDGRHVSSHVYRRRSRGSWWPLGGRRGPGCNHLPSAVCTLTSPPRSSGKTVTTSRSPTRSVKSAIFFRPACVSAEQSAPSPHRRPCHSTQMTRHPNPPDDCGCRHCRGGRPIGRHDKFDQFVRALVIVRVAPIEHFPRRVFVKCLCNAAAGADAIPTPAVTSRSNPRLNRLSRRR
jgi:hypothetical protein